jgi:hypothetical protein
VKTVKSPRHVALSRAYPPDLNPNGFAMTDPHVRQPRSRARRYLLVLACALAFAAYRFLTT